MFFSSRFSFVSFFSLSSFGFVDSRQHDDFIPFLGKLTRNEKWFSDIHWGFVFSLSLDHFQRLFYRCTSHLTQSVVIVIWPFGVYFFFSPFPLLFEEGFLCRLQMRNNKVESICELKRVVLIFTSAIHIVKWKTIQW